MSPDDLWQPPYILQYAPDFCKRGRQKKSAPRREPEGWGGERLLAGTVEEGDDLGPVAGIGCAEAAVTQTCGDAVFRSPGYGLHIEGAGRQVGEIGGIGSGGTALDPPQEGDHLGTVAGVTGVKVGVVNAIGDAVFQGPQDGLAEEGILGNIHEGIFGDGGFRASGGTPQEGNNLG